MSNNNNKKALPIASQAAIQYAKDNITPRVLKLNEIDANKLSLSKVIAYHCFEVFLIAKGEKISHAQIEQTIGLSFSDKITSKAKKVATYVNNEKPHRGKLLTPDMFRTSKDDKGEVIPAKLHVYTIAGQMGHDEAELKQVKKDTKSVVEQALAAKGLPVGMAEKMISESQAGDDSAMAFCKEAISTYTPINKKKQSKPVSISPQEALDLALDALIFMAGEGNDTATAQEWLRNAVELIGTETETETETETPIAAVA